MTILVPLLVKIMAAYFTEKFNHLVERASISELEALYVGAFIEELDMQDINQCPKVIVETQERHQRC